MRSRIVNAINIAGSIASITGITLLATARNVSAIQASLVISYAMSATLFLCIAGICLYGIDALRRIVSVKFGISASILVCAISCALAVWGLIYAALFLRMLAIEEFKWLLDQLFN